MHQDTQNSMGGVVATVDYLTVTTSDKATREWFYKIACDLLDEERTQPFPAIGAWSAHGYEGIRVGGLSWGDRETDSIIQISGVLAGAMYGDFIKHPVNCTRIDLAVTVRYNSPQDGIARNYFDIIAALSEEQRPPREYGLIHQLFGGDTLYVGKRTSATFGRVYNKGAESGDPGYENCWRWEVEIKKPVSQQVFKQLDGTPQDASRIASTVSVWYNERMVITPFSPTTGDISMETKRKESTTEKKLDWLRSQVRGTVVKLVEAGYLDDVAEALSMSEYLKQ